MSESAAGPMALDAPQAGDVSGAVVPESDGVGGMSYIGRTKCCGRVVAACCDDDMSAGWRREVAKFVADLVKGGYSVERVTDQYVRENLDFCECKGPRRKKKPDLFDAPTPPPPETTERASDASPSVTGAQSAPTT